MLRSIDASLKRLRTDFVEIAHIHDPDNHIEEALDAFPTMLELKEQGVIGAIGSGVNTLARAGTLCPQRTLRDCFLLAGRYTLLEQEPLHELFPPV